MNKNYFPELNSLRGFAALWVMAFHVWVMLGEPELNVGFGEWGVSLANFFSVGWAGVDIFFTLSAFLLTLPFAQWQLENATKPRLGIYFTRRVLRIFPAYYLQLFILLFIAFCFGIGRELNFYELCTHLVLWFFPTPPLNGVWWTLPIEFGFYLMLPILSYLLRPKRWVVLTIVAVTTTWSYRIAAYQWTADLPIANRVNVIEQLPGHLDQFVIGMIAAYALTALRSRSSTLSGNVIGFLFFLGLVGFIIMCWWIIKLKDIYWNGSLLLVFWHTIVSVSISLVLFSISWRKFFAKKIFNNKIFYYFGNISFGIYLWHLPILIWILPLLSGISDTEVRFLSGMTLTLVCSMVAAHISYQYIERPCLNLKK